MFKKVIPALLAMSLALSGCISISMPNTVRGSGKLASESREVSGFDSVVLKGSGDLTIEQGDSESLTIEADDNILPLIESKVENRKLTIGIKDFTNVQTNSPMRFTLKVKSLNEILLPGSGKIKMDGLKTGDFNASMAGSGTILLSGVEAQKVTLNIAGSGLIQVAGTCSAVRADIGGSGDINAADLACQDGRAAILGSGDIKLWVTSSLDAKIAGSGNVSYYGAPQVTSSITGSGNLIPLGKK